MRASYRLIASLFALGLIAAPAAAEEAWPTRVGRISLAETGAELRIGIGFWSDAVANEPIAAGTALRTGSGRAEIRLSGTSLTLAPASEIEIVRLDDDALIVALRRGRIGLFLDPRGAGQTVEIDTARGAVWPAEPGRYDIDASGAGAPIHLAAFAGAVRIAGPGIDTTTVAGTALMLPASGSALVSTPAAADAFAEWWQARAAAAAAAPPTRGPASLTGAAALADAGTWADSAFGPIWYPKEVSDGWAPFRYGSWRFLPPWGWTWIDDAAWGFAPSHYGRWVRVAGSVPDAARWGWVPGADDPEPAYLPAVVGFLGTPSIGLSYAGGSGPAVAWFPLGPGEPYWPGGKWTAAAIRRLNAGSVSDLSALAPGSGGSVPADIINGTYRNRRYASAVPRPIFVAGRTVAPALVQIPAERLDVAPLIPGDLGISPPPHPLPPVAATQPLRPPPAAAAAAKSRPHTVAALREHARLRVSLRRLPKPAPRQTALRGAAQRLEPAKRDYAAAARNLIRQ